MFYYQDTSLPSYKKLGEEHFQAEVFEFRKNRAPELHAFEAAPIGWDVKSVPTHFTKDTFLLTPYAEEEGAKVSMLQLIYRKGAFESFTLHTTSQNLREMTRWGMIDTSSVTGKVISALGQYRLTTFSERISAGYISNRHHEKFAILDMMQDRFEALSRLESLVNQNTAYGELPDALLRLQEGLHLYMEDLKRIKAKYGNQANAFQTIDEDIARAQAYLANMNKDNFIEHNRATGPYSILSFVRDTLILNLNEMQGLNKALTYTIGEKEFAGTSGDLNSCIVDAFQVVEQHDIDLHNAVLPGHHGRYGKNTHKQKEPQDPAKEEVFAYNSIQHKLSKKNAQAALIAISFIEGMNELHFPTQEEIAAGQQTSPYVINKHGRFSLRVVSATKWQTHSPIGSTVRTIGNFFVRIIGGFIDLAAVVVTLPLNVFTSFEWIHRLLELTHALATKEFRVLESDYAENDKLRGNMPILAGYEFRDKARPRLSSLVNKAAKVIINFFDNTVVDSARGIRDVILQLTMKAAHTVLEFHAEGYEKRDFDAVFSDVQTEATKLTLEIENRKAHVKKKQHDAMESAASQSRNQYLQRVIDTLETSMDQTALSPAAHHKIDEAMFENVARYADKYAVTEYVPTGAEMNDLPNAVVRGLKKFANVYMHPIYAKNKVAGLAFTALYAAGVVSVLMPSLATKYLSGKFVSFSQALGHTTAKGDFSCAIAAGVNEAQFAALIVEFMFHGPKSWLVSGVNELASDPATTMIYVGAAILIGDLAVYQFDIPLLSDEFRSNMGTVPPLALGFAGAKLGILLIEFVHAKERKELDQVTSVLEQLKQYLRDLYRQNHPDADSLEVNSFADRCAQQLLSAKNIDKIMAMYGNAKQDADGLQYSVMRNHINDTIRRYQVVMFIEENLAVLPYLSPEKKNEFMRQIRSHFTPEQAASLKKTLYPEGSRSIMRTTLGVVFGIVSAFVLLGFAAGSSIYHLNLKPWNAAKADYDEKWHGLKTRLKYGIAVLAQTILSVVNRMLILTPLDILANSIGARLFTALTGSHWLTRMNYRISGQFDRMGEGFYQRLSSFSGLGDDLKAFTMPHHADTRNKVGDSYLAMFKSLRPNELPKLVEEPQPKKIVDEIVDKVEEEQEPENAFQPQRDKHEVNIPKLG